MGPPENDISLMGMKKLCNMPIREVHPSQKTPNIAYSVLQPTAQEFPVKSQENEIYMDSQGYYASQRKSMSQHVYHYHDTV